jgi:hypothetical protein
MVLLRGSNTARCALLPTWRRKPLTVVRMAVGWWAKSSYTVMAVPAHVAAQFHAAAHVFKS